MKKKRKILIIDGNALIHRSFHALPKTLRTKDGQIVNAVYGFAGVLIKAIKEFKPQYIVLTLDRKEPTFRHKKYKEYKAQREKAPDELYEQIPLIKEIVKAFDIPIYEKAGFEADDLIGMISEKINGNLEKIIVTGDLDTLQLVNKNTKVYTMSRGVTDSVLYDEEKVKERFALSPRQIVDYKALRGDPSDNIPGVKGIGEKTAISLLQNFQTLENIYQNINSPKIKERTRKLLLKNKDNAFLSKELATIIRDNKIDFDLSKSFFKGVDIEKVSQIFSKLEFESLLSRLYEITKNNEKFKGEVENKFERNEKDFSYILVDDEKKFISFLKKLNKEKILAFDTETTHFDPIKAELLGISFSWKEKESYYVAVKKQKEKSSTLFDNKKKEEKGIDLNIVLKGVKQVLENKDIKKIGHNIKYDIQVMANYDIKVKGVYFDTRVASYLLNPGSRAHNLDVITFAYFNHQKINKKDLFPNKKDKIEFANIPLEKIFIYSCEDADFTFRLQEKLLSDLKKQKLEKLFFEIEMPLVSVLAKMERNGVKIDTLFLNKKSKDFTKRIEEINKKAFALAGMEFNLNSTKQLREVLFEKLNLPTNGIKKGKTGYSTSAQELEKLKDEHEIIGLIQENRELEKLKNTYIDTLPKLVNPYTKRLHTSFNQTATATGRLSSQNPNLQNIPVRTKEGKEIRRAFIAEKNFKLLSLDYSQIELRLVAHMSGDEKMIKAFKEGADIHRKTAAEIHEISEDKVTKELRRQAKAINFGILYGQGPHGLAQTADIPYARAQEFIEIYFSIFSGVKKYLDNTIQSAKEKGYVETMFGRRRYLPEINSNTPMIRKSAERMAINAPLQGTAADMIKIAMIKIHNFLNDNFKKGEVKMILQVHDELIFEIEENLLKKVNKEIKDIMENIVQLKVPIIVDSEFGDNWGEMKKLAL